MNRVIHFEIQADDVERAKKFYGQVLGWKIEPAMSQDKGDPMNYWMVKTAESGPGINGGLYERPKEGDKYYLYDCTVGVADIDKAAAAVKENGGTVVREKTEIPGVGWFVSAKDTEGNRFGLLQSTGWKPE